MSSDTPKSGNMSLMSFSYVTLSKSSSFFRLFLLMPVHSFSSVVSEILSLKCFSFLQLYLS